MITSAMWHVFSWHEIEAYKPCALYSLWYWCNLSFWIRWEKWTRSPISQACSFRSTPYFGWTPWTEFPNGTSWSLNCKAFLSQTYTHWPVHHLHTYQSIQELLSTCIRPCILAVNLHLWYSLNAYEFALILSDCRRNLAPNFSGLDIVSLFRSAVWWNTDFIWATNDGMLWMSCSLVNW